LISFVELGVGDWGFFQSFTTSSLCVLVSPFDPEAEFTADSLCRLEEAGLNIARPLMSNSSRLLKHFHAPNKAKQQVAGYKKRQEKLEFLCKVYSLWHSEESGFDSNWKTFLDLLTFLGLGGLRKRIENYLYSKQIVNLVDEIAKSLM